ncbi:MAG: Ldh family oxidoreductase [Betaproteobacteria bacterium]|nr:Ldh family oxidoreductase [Betaproteobacteria bacterium]
MNVTHDRVRQQIVNILRAWDMAEDLVQTTAEAMVETDLLGVDSHGISMLMTYEARKREGKLNVTAKPKIIRETPAMALIDGQAGLGHPVSVFAMNLAIDKALKIGVAGVGVRNSHHFGATGVYARIASKQGVIGMVTSATRGITMVPTRGKIPVLGTNPIAFSAPAKRNRPFTLDMATTTSAANKVKVYDLNNKKLPEGWVIDGAGNTVLDPAQARQMMNDGSKSGGITPLGGSEVMASYKGYGLAMMAHILGGTLNGGSFSPIREKTQGDKDPDNIGHFFLAIDPKAFRGEGEFENDLDEVIDILHATPPLDPSKPVLVAGDPEAAERERRLKSGIPIPEKLDMQIREICERSGAQYCLT